MLGNNVMFGGLAWWFWMLMFTTILVVVRLLWHLRPSTEEVKTTQSLHTLEKRYRKGDISRDEFNAKRRELVHQN